MKKIIFFSIFCAAFAINANAQQTTQTFTVTVTTEPIPNGNIVKTDSTNSNQKKAPKSTSNLTHYYVTKTVSPYLDTTLVPTISYDGIKGDTLNSPNNKVGNNPPKQQTTNKPK